MDPEVHVFHVNVSDGDSAIYLLVTPTATATGSGAPYTINRAVLIDGGWDNEVQYTLKTKSHIEASIEYIIVGPVGTKLLFDAVVITHWDEDHYTGIQKMLTDDFRKQAVSRATPVAPTTWLKHTANRTPAGTTWTSDSTFYAPYISKSYSETYGWNSKDLKSAPDNFVAITTMRTSTRPDLLQFKCMVPLTSGGAFTENRQLEIAKLRVGEDALGCELFTGDHPFTATTDIAACTGPTSLMTSHGHKKVGIYIVACDNMVLGGNTPLRSPMIVDKRIGGNNIPSITTMVIASDGVRTDPRLMHYSAGDAQYNTEVAVVNWAKNGLIDFQVPVVKASHHGSAFSTPRTVIESFIPSFIIVSAGTDNGHPMWESLAYWDAFYSKQDRVRAADAKLAGSDSIDPTQPVVATRKPYHFANKIEYNLSPWENPVPAAYRPLVDACKDFGSTFITAVKGNPATKRSYIRKTLSQRWRQISATDAIPSSLTDPIVYRGTPTPMGECILFQRLRIPSRRDTKVTHDSEYTNLVRVGRTRPYRKVFKVKVIGIPRLQRHAPRTLFDPSAYDKPYDIKKNRRKRRRFKARPVFLKSSEDDTSDDDPDFAFIATSPTTSDPFIASSAYQTTTLVASDAFDAFLSGTRTGFVSLQQSLGPSTATIQLASDDPISQWFQSCGLSISNFALTGTQNLGQTAISALSANVSVPGFGSQLSFSSSTINMVFGPVGTSITGNGIMPRTGIALMALNQQSPVATYTLHQLFSVPNFEHPKSLWLGLTDDIQFKIDTRNGSRCGLWYSPNADDEVMLRLQFVPVSSNFLTKVNTAVAKVVSIEMKDIYLISTFSTNCEIYPDGTAMNTRSEITLAGTFQTSGGHILHLFLVFHADMTSIIIHCDDAVSFNDIFDWLQSTVQKHVGKLPRFQDWIKPLTQDIYFRQLTLALSDDAIPKLLSIKVDLEVVINFSSKGEALFLMSYAWPANQFTGIFWNAFGPDPDYQSLPGESTIFAHFPNNNYFAEHELYKVILPLPVNQPKSRDDFGMADLDPTNKSGVTPAPSGIDSSMFMGCSLTVDPNSISFSAGLDYEIELTNSSVPAIIFDSATLAASHKFKDGTTSFKIDTKFSLLPRGTEMAPEPDPSTEEYERWQDRVDHTPVGSATLFASMSYNSGIWTLEADMMGFNLGVLYSLFAHKDVMANFLENITISYLLINYQFAKSSDKAVTNSVPSSLTVTGAILIGLLDFDFNYFHRGDNNWGFEATLGAAGAPCTLSAILGSICLEDVAGFLPSFIGNITVPPKDIVFEIFKLAADGSHVQSTTEAPAQLVSAFSILLPGGFRISFVQFQKTKAGNGTEAAGEAKKLLRVSSKKIAAQVSLPVVGTVKTPVDEIDFVWVSDASADSGITSDELDGLNDSDVFKSSQLPPLRKPATSKSSSVAFATGSHFLLMDNGHAVFDYVFGQSTKAEPAPSPSSVTVGRSRAVASGPVETPQVAQSGPSTKMPFKKTIGPLTISNIGLHLRGDSIIVLLDAEVKLGPFAFELIDCGIGFDLSKINFTQFDSAGIQFELSGLALSWADPPVEIAALFEVVGPDSYAGGVTMTMEPYAFAAFGSYNGSVKIPGHDPFKSIFIFAELHGPLVELEFAELQGIKLGFGYNSQLSLPTLADVPHFPFVAGVNGTDPIAVLTSLCQPVGPTGSQQIWVAPKEGPMWLAAGLDITAFDIVDVTAVVVFEFNPLILSILANATAQMPKPNKAISDSTLSREVTYVYAEMAIVSTVDFAKGSLTILGALAPNSFVMNPSCHLSGGFGLCYWFSGSGHDGDWVFTIGGYHPQFVVPSHYPKPDRLGISWQVDPCLSVHGQAYFAITPHCCMGGGMLMANFSCGPLSAHFNAWADFLVNFSPLYYQVSVGVSVEIDFDLDLWICTIHISCSIDATLLLHGPPVGGVAHVDFWVFGFDIYFGDNAADVPKFNLERFANLLLQQSNTPSDGGDIPTVQTSQKTHVYALKAGAYPNKKDKKADPDTPDDGKPWNVRGDGLVFRLHSRMAISEAQIGNSPTALPDKPGGLIGSRSMGLVTQVPTAGDASAVTQSITSQLAVTCVDMANRPVPGFGITPIMKDVPRAVWGSYSEDTDPTKPNANTNAILNPKDVSETISLMLGVEITSPKPTEAGDLLKPFNVHDAFNHDCFEQGPDPILGAVLSQTMFMPGAASAAPKLDASKLINLWVDKMGWVAAKTANGEKMDPLVMSV